MLARAGLEGVNDSLPHSFVFKIPYLQPPQVPALVPLPDPLANMNLRLATAPEFVLGQPIQKIGVAFQSLQQSDDSSSRTLIYRSQCEEVVSRVSVDQQVWHYI